MALGPKGIDVRQTSGQLVFRSSLKDATGAKLATGTTTLSLYEVQDDGTLKSYDFTTNTFKTTALTTETQAMTHRTGNNGTTNTGIWTVALATLSGFTAGGVYIAVVSNTSASPPQQEREFQFGSAEGDMVVTSTGYLKSDTEEWKGATAPAMTGDAYARIGANGAGLTGVGLDSAQRIKLNTSQPDYAPSKAGDAMTLTAAYDLAKTAAQVGDVMKVSSGTGANQVNLSGGNLAGPVPSVTAAVTVGTNNDKTGYGLAASERVKLAASQPDYAPAVAGAAMTLTAGERTSLATVLEAAMLDEGDASALLTAIAAKVEQFLVNEGDATATLAAIGTAVRAALATELARIDVALSSRLATSGYTTPPTANANGAAAAAAFSFTGNLDTLLASILSQATSAATDADTAGTAAVAAQTRVELALPAVAPGVNGGLPLQQTIGGQPTLTSRVNLTTTQETTLTDLLGALQTAVDAIEDLTSLALPNSGFGQLGGLPILEFGPTGESPRIGGYSKIGSTTTRNISEAVRDVDNTDPFPNSLGEAINNAGGSSASDIAQAVWEFATRTLSAFPSGVPVVVVSPLSPNGKKLALKAGDAYLRSNGAPIIFRFTGKPDITDVPMDQLRLGFGFGDDPTLLTIQAIAKTASADIDEEQTVTFEMTSDDSSLLLDSSPLEFTFEVAYTAGEPTTVSEGPVYVSRRRTV